MSVPETIIAIDPGTNAGWAVSNRKTGKIYSGAWNCGRVETWVKFVYFFKSLSKKVDKLPKPVLVVYEKISWRSNADEIYSGFRTLITIICGKRELVDCTSVSVGTWKKHLCGTGKASKGQVSMAVGKRNLTFSTQDEADAIGILLWAVNKNWKKKVVRISKPKARRV